MEAQAATDTAAPEPPPPDVQAPAEPLHPAVFRVKSALEAITLWRLAMELAAELKADFERTWADSLMEAINDPEIAPGLKNDSSKKAYADLQSNDAMRRADIAAAKARAAGAVVDLFVGRGRS